MINNLNYFKFIYLLFLQKSNIFTDKFIFKLENIIKLKVEKIKNSY